MLGVLLALLLTGLGTHAIKDGLGLPRPVRVDARVLDKGKTNRQWLTERGGAPSAFGLPSEQAIAAARALHNPDFGFTSGHVTAATAFCTSLLLVFTPLRRRCSIARRSAQSNQSSEMGAIWFRPIWRTPQSAASIWLWGVGAVWQRAPSSVSYAPNARLKSIRG